MKQNVDKPVLMVTLSLALLLQSQCSAVTVAV